MASGSCMRLCHRCTRSFFVLHSKVAGDALRYSAQVQRYSTAFRISSSSASSTSFSAVSGKPQHARHRWRRLYSGDVMSGKALSAQATDSGENAGEPSTRTDADAAPCRPDPPSSQRVGRVAAPTATASPTALLDPDAVRTPLPVLLEEARDEETVSAARPRRSVLKKTIDEEAVSTARPRHSVLKKTIGEEAVSAARPRRSVLLDKLSDEEEDISVAVSPDLPPPASQSLVDYVDQSETLSKLVQLGVNLWRLEQRPSVGTMLLKLDFQADVAPRLLFLRDVGVEEAGLGRLLSHNPFILTESLENLHARVNYLRSRGFSSQAVASMVARAPYLLNFSVKRLDNRLAFFQQQLGLSPDNTRDIVARLPRLLCGSLERIKETLKVCKVEFGFKDNEVQHIVRAVPKVLTANKMKLTQIFDYVHNTMHVPHHLIVKFPQVLNCAFLRVRERHLFLQYLSRAQYDPGQPRYVSLDRLASLPDPAFCSQVAEATLDDFHLFQKTL